MHFKCREFHYVGQKNNALQCKKRYIQNFEILTAI